MYIVRQRAAIISMRPIVMAFMPLRDRNLRKLFICFFSFCVFILASNGCNFKLGKAMIFVDFLNKIGYIIGVITTHI